MRAGNTQPVNMISTEFIDAPQSMAFDKEGSRLAVSSCSGQLAVFQMGDDEQISRGLTIHRLQWIDDAQVSAIIGVTANNYLITYRLDSRAHANIVTIRRLESLEIIHEFQDKTSLRQESYSRRKAQYFDRVRFALTGQSRILVRVGDDMIVRIYDLIATEVLDEREQGQSIVALDAWPEGTQYAIATEDGCVYVSGDLLKGEYETRRVFRQKGGGIRSIACGGKGRQILTGTDRALFLWSPSASRSEYSLERKLSTRSDTLRRVGIIGDGSRGYSIDSHGCAFWDLAKGQRIGRWEYELLWDIASAAIGSPNGRFGLVASKYDGILFFELDAESLRP